MGDRRRNPFRGFLDTMSEMNRARYVGMGAMPQGVQHGDGGHATAWVPPADIFSAGRDLVILISLSGVRPEDVDVTLDDGVLTVSGERGKELDEGDSVYVQERLYGSFRRSMTLPAGVERSQIGAELENGLLRIKVRDAAAASEPQRIEVRDSSSYARIDP